MFYYKISRLDYVLVFFFLVISGNPVVRYIGDGVYIMAVIMLVVIAAMRKCRLSSKFFIRWIIGLSLLFMCQFLSGEMISLPANINFIAKFYSCFLIAEILGEKFRYVYLRVIVFISVISIPLFVINYIGIEFPGLTFDRYVSWGVYNYIPVSHFESMRNSGMFWEPGAYQGYLLLVPLMYIGNIKQFFKENKRISFLLIAALLTTMSTTGYLTLFLLIVMILLKNIKNVALCGIVITGIILLSIWSFNYFDFLGEKLTSEYNNAISMEAHEISWTRMGSAQIDIQNISRHPIIGNGFLMDQKYPGIGELMAGAGNGFTGVFNSFGIPFVLIFLYFVYRKAPSNSQYDKFVFLVTYIMLLNGEYFLNYPFFWIVLFVSYVPLKIPNRK